MSTTKDIFEWLTTKVAKENLDLSTERDIFKAECDRLGSGYDATQTELAALREELAELRQQHAEQSCVFCNNSGELLTKVKTLQSSLTAAEQRNVTLGDALLKIIEMNRQHAEDQYGDPDKAESWACIRVAREALAQPTESGASE